MDPDNIVVIKNMAKIFAKLRQFDKSREYLMRIISPSALDFNVVNMICECFFAEELFMEALAYLQPIFNH